MTKQETKSIKGVAILLMLTHHLWGFPDRIVDGGLQYFFSVFEQPLTLYLGDFAKICVHLFFFISGYGLFRSCADKETDIIKRVKKLYFSYWKVFLIFIPVAFLFFRHQPQYCAEASICTRYSTFIWAEFIENFLGISSTYNSEWWFFREYLIALLLFPAVKAFVNKHSDVVNVVAVLIVTVLISTVFPMLAEIPNLSRLNNDFIYMTFLCKTPPYISCFLIGCVLAKNDLLGRMRQMMEKNRLNSVIADLGIIGAVIFLRNTGYREEMSVLYVPMLVICNLDLLRRCKWLDRVFSKLGEHSTNIWLIHTFLCYYFYPVNKVVTCTRCAVPSLIILLVLSFILSLAVNFIWSALGKLYCLLTQKNQAV